MAAEERPGSAHRERTPSVPAARNWRSGPAAAGRSRSDPRGRPAPLVRAEPVGEQDPAVDQGRVGELRQPRAETLGPVAVEQQAEAGADRSLLGRARPEAALLDQGPGPGRGVGFQPGEPRGPRRDRRRGARARIAAPSSRHRRAPRAGRGRRDRGGRGSRGPSSVRQDGVQWRVQVDLEPPAIAEVANGDPGAPRGVAAARCRTRGPAAPRGARCRRPRSRPRSSGCWRGPCPRDPRRQSTNACAIRRRASGQAAGAEDDDAVAGRRPNSLTQRRAERPGVPQLVDDLGVAPRSAKPAR